MFGPSLLNGLSARQEVPFFPDAAGIPTLRQELPRLAIELERARRHVRPLSVVLVSLAYRHPGGAPETAAELYPLLSVLLAQTLRETLRQVDIVTHVTAQARSVVVLPETSGEGARRVVERLDHVPALRLLAPLRTGVAAFPEDGWTFDEILKQADDEWTAAEAGTRNDGGER
jgi:hypothetical protein